MKVKNKLVAAGAAAFAVLYFGQSVGAQTLSKQSIPDISEFQNTLTTATAKQLKGEAGGVILRTGYGENRKDYHIDGNLKAAESAGLAYGVYQYGQFINASDARSEARATYKRAPHAKFYINDAEEYTTTSGSYATAVRAWATEMRKLTKKKIIIYSYRGFYNSYIKSDAGYDAKWIAAYQKPMPTPYDYALWQNENAHYFLSLKQATDASKIVTSKHSMAWWFGSTVDKSKFTVGGFKTGDKVKLKTGITYYGTKTKADESLANTALTVKTVRAVYTGKSNQVLTVYHGSKVIGQARAQDVTKVKSSTSKPKNKANWVRESKTYTLKAAVNLRKDTSTGASVIAVLPAGTTVKTDRAIIKGGYRWVRQPRATGYGYLVTGPANDTLAYVKSGSSHTYYTVKSGDSWWAIATKFGIDMNKLAKLNGKTKDSMLHPGDKLIIK
ncbi:GH25 family lysozyme [Lactiplantibacillus carotarum]|uniref:GH25 family lysozyme n=1 Tax=Lactiplantibacillus carotarum TaxID=2993456 RepID=UPI00298F1F7C|nr:GH25 family lysozyme [Lactiplantibacillus carotarum]